MKLETFIYESPLESLQINFVIDKNTDLRKKELLRLMRLAIHDIEEDLSKNNKQEYSFIGKDLCECGCGRPKSY